MASESYRIPLGAKGRIVLPAELRRKLSLKEGELLRLTAEADGSLRLRRNADGIDRLCGILKDLVPPGVSLADELIADRRAEALKEEQDQ